MPEVEERRVKIGVTEAVYRTDSGGTTELMLIPADTVAAESPHRETLTPDPALDHLPWKASLRPVHLDSLVQLSIAGRGYPGGFSQGRTMRNGPAVTGLRFESQSRDGDHIETTLTHPDGFRVVHHLKGYEGEPFFRMWTVFFNESDAPIELEMISSFSLTGITPFDPGQAPERLRLHRFRSSWSAEGRLVTQPLEDLNLERSWIGHSANCERFGQVGSMPVRGFFPTAAVEDTVAGVLWGAALEWAGSWQIELYRQHDHAALSGGLADRELGHWVKSVAPDERFETPKAVVACVSGDIEDVCAALVSSQREAAAECPEADRDLPVVFNEWCTTWGNPSHENLMQIADRLEGLGIRYLVIDAGWYKRDDSDWGNGQGDWEASGELFPDGLAATAQAVRERGLIPGLWFEMEVAGSSSRAYSRTDLQLTRDGVPLTVGGRRFWDLRNPDAVAYLADRVIGTLRDAGIGYLKVDYNETIGIGVDGAESPGEGLRRHIEGVYRFFRRIREELPELVIENCSSGGHRLEPSMIALTDMSSFSDAHESLEIPIIAANLHRLILPAQSQIWAVLHADDTIERTRYLLTSGFLGRMCLSGEIRDLDSRQMDQVRRAVEFYGSVAEIIRDGRSRIQRTVSRSYRAPVGNQCVIRTTGARCLAVVHSFDHTGEQSFSAELPEDGYRMTGRVSGPELSGAVAGRRLVCRSTRPFSGAVFLLEG